MRPLNKKRTFERERRLKTTSRMLILTTLEDESLPCLY
jgi:hypothetical protein